MMMDITIPLKGQDNFVKPSQTRRELSMNLEVTNKA